MENSFLFATNTRHIAALVSRLRMLTELEIQSLPFIAFYSACCGLNNSNNHNQKKNLGDMVVLSPENLKKPDFNPILSDSDKLHKIDNLTQGTLLQMEELKTSINNTNIEFHNKITHLGEKIVNIEDKLDRILNWITSREIDQHHHQQQHHQQHHQQQHHHQQYNSNEKNQKDNYNENFNTSPNDTQISYSYYGEGDEDH